MAGLYKKIVSNQLAQQQPLSTDYTNTIYTTPSTIGTGMSGITSQLQQPVYYTSVPPSSTQPGIMGTIANALGIDIGSHGGTTTSSNTSADFGNALSAYATGSPTWGRVSNNMTPAEQARAKQEMTELIRKEEEAQAKIKR